ncbi:hypothetical protein BOTCAL_0091g00130 [Botryotinia calthae]|uniref:Uncharacterized protein n=1 Tax=Botryotinia calthae TaxID=38488 RepID=A0A4Y8D710_9HELO|nr:hypothetical protein BOTCAL_0091g00130 [Botryotinia calthae]
MAIRQLNGYITTARVRRKLQSIVPVELERLRYAGEAVDDDFIFVFVFVQLAILCYPNGDV